MHNVCILGYKEICGQRNAFIHKEQALGYALDQIQKDPKLCEEFEEWFFSGEYVTVYEWEEEEIN